MILLSLQGGLSPTITKNLNMDKEAGRLHDAVKGLGTDETCIVRILSKFTNKGRKRLLKAYKDRFNEVSKTTYTKREFFCYPSEYMYRYSKGSQHSLKVMGARKNGAGNGRVSPLVCGPVLSCTHNFQAPATQATAGVHRMILIIIVQRMIWSLIAITIFAGKWYFWLKSVGLKASLH